MFFPSKLPPVVTPHAALASALSASNHWSKSSDDQT
jgi:hypothetical protein